MAQVLLERPLSISELQRILRNGYPNHYVFQKGNTLIIDTGSVKFRATLFGKTLVISRVIHPFAALILVISIIGLIILIASGKNDQVAWEMSYYVKKKCSILDKKSEQIKYEFSSLYKEGTAQQETERLARIRLEVEKEESEKAEIENGRSAKVYYIELYDVGIPELQGPYDYAEISGMLEGGQIKLTTMIRKGLDTGTMRPLHTFPEFTKSVSDFL